MDSFIARALELKYEPVVISGSNERPRDAIQFKEGKMGCVIDMLAAAVQGRTVVFDRKTCGCPGGGTGLGFGNQYKNMPGGEEAFCYFLSFGAREWKKGMWLLRFIKPFMNNELSQELHRNFLSGERYLKNPDRVKRFLNCLPITEVPYEYVIFKPLNRTDWNNGDSPRTIVFLADYDQLSAMVCLANYDRESNDNVIIPWAAGCQTIGIYPLRESERENPRAVVGLVDIYSRVKLKRRLKADLMSFTVPVKMFREMEMNVSGSFLEQGTWKDLMSLKRPEEKVPDASLSGEVRPWTLR